MSKKKEEQMDGQLNLWDFCLDSSNYVVQANRLISGKQGLKLNSAKLIRAAIMQIKPEDTEFKPYIIKIKEFADLLNVDPSNVYKSAEELTDDILRNPVYISETESGEVKKFVKIPWVQFCEYSATQGIAIQLNERLKPFLIGLKEHYSQYSLDTVLSMKSIYAIRIYELIQSKIMFDKMKRNHTVTLTIEEIRESCDCQDKYERFSSFRSRVLDVAINEINASLFISEYKYDLIKTGREFTAVKFHIKRY